jgi:hypothetical protein
MYTPRKLLAKKLCRLSSFLNHACEEFDKVARYVKEKKIRMSVRSVVLETRQYMNELDSQLQTLSVKCIIRRVNNELNNRQMMNNITDKKIIKLCCKSEEYFEKAYRSILNEYFPYTGLRDILIYQLNGIKCAFMQLKLLNSVMPSKANISNVLF